MSEAASIVPGADPGPPPGDRTTTFFPQPVIDQLLRAITSLTMELSVTRERLATLEHYLSVPAEALDGVALDATAAAARAERNRTLITEILGPFADMFDKA